MDRNEFLEAASAPEFGNAMSFVIRKENPDGESSFSQEALDAMTDNMRAFVWARVWGEWQRTGKPPTGLRAEVTLHWDGDITDRELEERPVPWWSINDPAVDGTHRDQARRRCS